MKRKLNQLLLAIGMITFFAAGLIVLPLFGLPYVPLTQIAQQNPYTPIIVPKKIVQIVIFAADNGSNSVTNLTPRFPELMDSLIAASRGVPEKTSVVLADLDQDDDTQIMLVHDGIVTSVAGLPDITGTLVSTAVEYDMTDGEALGGFLRWALETLTNEATNTVLSYYGHGTFVTPSGDLTTVPGMNRQGGEAFAGDMLSFTDEHPPQKLISPYALRRMLEVGTDNGRWTLDVLDLTHSFALTLEEVYELINDGGAPFAAMLVGSPSYAYFAPKMAGEVLGRLTLSADSATLATNVIDAYDHVLAQADLMDGDPDVDHPRVLTVIDSAMLRSSAEHPDIKTRFDELSTSIVLTLWNDPLPTIEKLRLAAANTQHYDTTSCNLHDWEINTSDALLDAGEFLPEIAQQFGTHTTIGLQAMQTYTLLSRAVVAQRVANGSPWFAAPTTTNWTFDTDPLTVGIGLYSDFVGFPDGSARTLSWQSSYYNETVSQNNPFTLRFIDARTGITWSDVINYYRSERANNDGLTPLAATACVPHLMPLAEAGELVAEAITLPVAGTVSVGHPMPLQVTIRTETTVINPMVQFNVYQSNTLVFSDTVGAGYLISGTHAIDSSRMFTPTVQGEYTFEVIVDSDNRIYEIDELNNTVQRIENVRNQMPFELNVTMQDERQWVHDNTFTLNVTSTIDMAVLVGQIYEYRADDDLATYVPVATHQWNVFFPDSSLVTVILPPSVNPGHLILHVWGIGYHGDVSQSAEIIRFNYVPNNSTLAAGERAYFKFEAATNEDVTILFDVASGDAMIRVWEPNDHWTALQLAGSGSIQFNPAQGGTYLVEVESAADGTIYSVASQRNGPSNRVVNEVVTVNRSRPNLQMPIVAVPNNPTHRLYTPIIPYKVNMIDKRLYIPIIAR